MRAIIVGAGPTGLFTAIALARRGSDVVLVDRDPGPPVVGSWHRKGVMQFHHAHTFRGPVVEALLAEMPDVLEHLVAAGAAVADAPDGRPAALLCRRATFDAVLRRRALEEPGVSGHTGHVDGLVRQHGRVRGVTLLGRQLTADVVIDASGRASRFTGDERPPAEGSDCGAVYIDRQYRLHDDAPSVPVNSPIGLTLSFVGYFAIGFLHDDRTFSITLAHDGTDRRLRRLRRADVFESAVGAIPQLSEWTDPDRSVPIAPVRPGGKLVNGYRGQLNPAGRPATPGMISVGDAVCTTTPLAGRGVTLALAQSRAMIGALDHHGTDIDSATMQFDHWCTKNIRPWFDDHVHNDADRLRRWSGGDVDTTRRLPSDLVVAAATSASADDAMRTAVAPYARMDALPASLDPVEPRAREIYAAGWRPDVPDGPTRAELADLCDTARDGAA
ncbi:FAD-dependent oxidoreductase [Mycolicibacterium sp. P9-64]|uniref:NAD(P)/FAD-dependent oxidoreductase n=1 Tax=Mycolicibacterium sp. P9-64 TaxID=2024612 RepID=UPI0011ECD62B|nr:FAD-dependent oxidoreductase [Mycolicibacterium sp. P9-64]KAA0081964.1 FAD-dependent oxidoreductase [Mycolicibacterium sp. P9-64]